MAKKKSPRKKTTARGKKNARTASSPSGEQRLQRVLASAGLGSRRECETLIEDGRVEVDGQFVTKLGVKVDPSECKIRVDGTPVKLQRLQYFAVNKPPGVVSTSSDPSGRLRVIDLIKTSQRVYNVGRLDKSSEGLILVTNDGDLANQLTHPRYGVQKTYLVQVVGQPERGDLKKLERGVYLAEGLAKVVGARIKSRSKDHTMLEIILEEGRNREIRRLLASIGHKVVRLRRVAIGTLRLGDLPLGAHRTLDKREIDALKRLASEPASKKPKSKGRSRKAAPKGTRGGGGKTERPSRGAKPGKATGRGRAERDSSESRESYSVPGRRKRKPKVGEEGWTIKSGGKPRKKKYTKKQLAEFKANREAGPSGKAAEEGSERSPRRSKKSATKKNTTKSRKTTKSGSKRGKSKRTESVGRGKARAAAKTTGRKSKKSTKKSPKRSTKKSVGRSKSKRR